MTVRSQRRAAEVAILITVIIGFGIWATHNEPIEARSAIVRELEISDTVPPPLEQTTVQIAAIDAVFASGSDQIADVCGSPFLDTVTDAWIVEQFEVGFGERLTPEAAAHLVRLVRTC